MYRTDPKYWDIILYRSCLKIWTKSFYYLLMWLKTAKWVANSVDPDQMPHFLASDLGLLRPVYPTIKVNIYSNMGKFSRWLIDDIFLNIPIK